MGTSFSSDKITSPIPQLNHGVRVEQQNKSPNYLSRRMLMRVYQSMESLDKVIDTEEIKKLKELNRKVKSEYMWVAGIAALASMLLNVSLIKRQKRSLAKKNLSLNWKRFIKYVPLTVVGLVGFHMGIYYIIHQISDLNPEIDSFFAKNDTELNHAAQVEIQQKRKQGLKSNIK